MITEKDYLNLKEMYDYKRKIEKSENATVIINNGINIDECIEVSEVMFTDATEEDMFDTFWSKMKDCENKLERPPKTWIPKNEKLRKWDE